MKHSLIYLVTGTIAILFFVFGDIDFTKDSKALFNGILLGWIIAAWVIFLLKPSHKNIN
tara:strand:- start:25539 stop:25715 length:177 start_codon:yes stop_codon:yes gene_type:complete